MVQESTRIRESNSSRRADLARFQPREQIIEVIENFLPDFHVWDVIALRASPSYECVGRYSENFGSLGIV